MEELYRYISEHSTKQSEALDWVERQTNIRTNHARMLSGAVQGQLMKMIVEMSGAKRVIELGTFTGYSAICLAQALPEDGHIDTLEINDELEDLIVEGFERAGVNDKITLHIGDCKQTLARFIEELDISCRETSDISCGSDSSKQATLNTDCPSDPAVKDAFNVHQLYDIAYIDANKREYCEYYRLIKQLVRKGGYIIADNVLWSGKVCDDTSAKSNDRQTQGILEFNDMVAADPEVENVIIPLRDGMNLIRIL